MRSLFLFFIFLAVEAQTVPVRTLLEAEMVLPIDVDKKNVIPLLPNAPLMFKSISDEPSITFLFVETSNLPKAQRQILFNKDSQGKICVLKKDLNKEDAIKSALTARRNNTVIFKSEKNNLDKFAVEFKFSKIPRLTLSVIISCDKSSCPEDVIYFIKDLMSSHFSLTQKTFFTLSILGILGLVLTENKYKARLIKANPFLGIYAEILRASRRISQSDHKKTFADLVKRKFLEEGVTKKLLTAQDLWGCDKNKWNNSHYINACGLSWVNGSNKTAILILTMAEIQHPEIMKFLQAHKDTTHNEQRSKSSLSTGTGYGADKDYLIFNEKKCQSIKAGDRILLINDGSQKCPVEYKAKSAITWDGKMYGQIDSRSPEEIIRDLESTLWSEKLIQINKFFDLEMSL